MSFETVKVIFEKWFDVVHIKMTIKIRDAVAV
jgi:hypothetical protein